MTLMEGDIIMTVMVMLGNLSSMDENIKNIMKQNT